MAIEFHCSGCDKLLRVTGTAVGHDVVCPGCGAASRVPSDGHRVDDAPGSAPRIETADWHVRTGDGEMYGPVPRTDLDKWLDEGRIDDGCQILHEGWSQWKWAPEVLPQMRQSAGAPPRRPTSEATAYLRPHRGTMVLILGIMSLVCCSPLGIAAWIMGRSDLRAMKDGRMDPGGEGITQAGYICGIIGTILLLVNMLAFGMFVVLSLLGAAAG